MSIAFLGLVNLFGFFLVFPLALQKFYRKKSFTVSVFSLFYSLLFSLVPAVSNLTIGAFMYHPEAKDGAITDIHYYQYYVAANLLFSLFVFVNLMVNDKRAEGIKNLDSARLVLLKKILAAIFLFAVVLYVFSTGFRAPSIIELLNNIISAGRMAHYQNEDYNVFLMNVSFYLMSTVAAFTFLNVLQTKKTPLLTSMVYLFLILVTVLSGARQFIMLAISAFVIAYSFTAHYSTKKITIIVISGFVLLVCWQVIRAAIFKGDAETITFDRIVQSIVSGDLSYFYYSSLEAIRQYLEHDLLFFANTFRNLLLMPFPSSLTFGLKQPDMSSLFNVAYQSSSELRSGNYPPGMIGLFILNFGMAGVILVGVPLLFFINFSQLMLKVPLFAMSFGSCYVFLILQLFRGTLMGFYQSVALLLICWGITVLLTLLKVSK